jgi:hypothetical protein
MPPSHKGTKLLVSKVGTKEEKRSQYTLPLRHQGTNLIFFGMGMKGKKGKSQNALPQRHKGTELLIQWCRRGEKRKAKAKILCHQDKNVYIPGVFVPSWRIFWFDATKTLRHEIDSFWGEDERNERKKPKCFATKSQTSNFLVSSCLRGGSFSRGSKE